MRYEAEYSWYKGWPSNIVKRLNISVGLYLRNYKYVKVGITNDPDRRFGEHQKSRRYNWERMVVVYITDSVNNANAVEDWFIANRKEFVNKWTGRSNMSETGPYYAYFLLGNHKRRK